MHILFASYDQNLLAEVQNNLIREWAQDSSHRFTVVPIGQLLRNAKNPRYELIFLGLGRASYERTSQVGLIRRVTSVPILVLCTEGDENEEIFCLRSGAPHIDFIRKPLSCSLLMARLEALSRRYAAEPTESDESVLRVGELELDPMKFTFSVGGTPVSLTKTQYRMMARMMRHPGNVFSRVMLQKDQRNPGMKVWDERSIDSEIKRIRKKIKDSNGDTDHIEALYGVGYRVRDPRKPLASGADLSWQHLDKVEEVAQLIRVRERV